MAEDPAARKRRFLRAVQNARTTDDRAVFVADDARIGYENRRLRLELAGGERERLESLLGEYHVFKIEAPATRKADDGVVYVSAVTDPKRVADFLEALFREVYGAAADYELSVEAG